MKLRLAITGLVLAVMTGCSTTQPSITSAFLVDQTKKAGQSLLTNPDPAVQVAAKDIVANMEVVANTDYSEFQEAIKEANIPYSPEMSAEKRTEKVEEAEASSGLWGLIKAGVKKLPGGEWLLIAATGALAWWQSKRVREWIKLARVTFQAIEKDGSNGIKAAAMAAHAHANVGHLASKLADEVKIPPSPGNGV